MPHIAACTLMPSSLIVFFSVCDDGWGSSMQLLDEVLGRY